MQEKKAFLAELSKSLGRKTYTSEDISMMKK